MIKQLEEVSIDQVNNNQTYIVLVEPNEYYLQSSSLHRGNGREIIESLKGLYGFEDEENEGEERDFEDFFNDVNGDGKWSTSTIFKI